MYKKISIAVLTLSLLTAGYWLSTRSHKAAANDTLIVGTNVGYPPFIFTANDGTVIGFDADIAAAIAEKLNKKLVIKDMAFDALLLALSHGSVDMIIGGISITKERKKSDLLIPYYCSAVDSVALFYPGKKAHKKFTLKTLAEQKMTVCTQAGSVFEEIVMAFPGITIKTVPDIADIVMEVTQGSSECGLLDTDSVRALAHTSPDLKWHEESVPASAAVEGFGLGVTHKNTAFRAEILAAIKQLQSEGAIESLAHNWFSTGA